MTEKSKILVVDDEPEVCGMLRSHFELRGYTVKTAGDGGEGIQACAQYTPDVILLDLKMKDMDGDRAVPELRRLAPKARIYVISAYQDTITQKRLAGLPIDGFFEKPVSLATLQSLLS